VRLASDAFAEARIAVARVAWISRISTREREIITRQSDIWIKNGSDVYANSANPKHARATVK
jgi:hypothetical protein